MNRPAGKGRRRNAMPGARTWLYARDRDAGRFRVPPSMAGPKRVFVCCCGCGHEVPDVPADGACPKCGGHSWERFALSARLLPRGPAP